MRHHGPGFFGARHQRDAYHHGSLKTALLDSAEALIAERGPAGITLSEMARMAGVTPAAVYRHYADLRALIGAVARRGFEDFTVRMRACQPGATGFASMGDIYLGFAQERPGAYAAMFSSTVSYTDPDLEQAGKQAFETLLDGIVSALKSHGISREKAYQLALKVWALSHGVATLAQSGRLSPATGCVPQDILRDGVDALIAAAVQRHSAP